VDKAMANFDGYEHGHQRRLQVLPTKQL